MKKTVPEFYDEFQCINSACTDSCCIGWEIDIDPFTMGIYNGVEGKFGKRLRDNIKYEENEADNASDTAEVEAIPHFILQKDERCPFLNQKNLCDIFIHLGEDCLCDICTEHPRFYNWFHGMTEAGLGLCCEEAARLLFSSEESLMFFMYEDDQESDDEIEMDEEIFSWLYDTREMLFAMLRNREDSIQARAGGLLQAGKQLTDGLEGIEELDEEEYAEIFPEEVTREEREEALTQLLEFYLSLESMDPYWQKSLNAVKENLTQILQAEAEFEQYLGERSYEYEHFLGYSLYRYFLKSVFDYKPEAKIALVVSAYEMIRLVDIYTYINKKEYTLKDRVEIVKGFSKDVEYSEENLETVENEWEKGGCLSMQNLWKAL